MKILETGLQGLLVIQPDIFTDSRGYFFESFNQDSFKIAGINFIPIQDNESRSSRGVIRGLHYQLNPHAQAKLIRVVVGKIYDIALDLRKESRHLENGLEWNLTQKQRNNYLSQEVLHMDSQYSAISP
jgi:dTDP-4-dehydrorhamnose 3,5-epimerase